jgi:hypothetical protein
MQTAPRPTRWWTAILGLAFALAPLARAEQRRVVIPGGAPPAAAAASAPANDEVDLAAPTEAQKQWPG